MYYVSFNHFKNTLTPLRFPRFFIFISKLNKGNERKGKEKESSQKQKTKTGKKKTHHHKSPLTPIYPKFSNFLFSVIPLLIPLLLISK